VPLKRALKRELEVAFSKHAQPVWFRIVKYIVIATLLYFFWGSPWLWITFLILLGPAIGLHLWYRHKTGGWTKSYGGWDYEKNKSRLKD
jgi:chromate transport protein ChrA